MPNPIHGVDASNPVTPTATAQTGSSQSADAVNVANPPVSAGPGGADLADVAQTEALLQTIIQVASSTPGVDQSKVAELQQAISSGAYQANPQSIAQKIVELEAQLGTAGQVQ